MADTEKGFKHSDVLDKSPKKHSDVSDKSPKPVFSLRLLFKTAIHLTYLVICHAVFIQGCFIWFGIRGEQLENVYLSNLKWFIICYGTNWNYFFQTTFLFLALAHDVLEWASKEESSIAQKIKYLRDILFAALVVPYTCFVFIMFWTLYAIDRELIFPEVYDAVVPWWFNQCVHTNIMVLVVIETVLQPRRYPTDRRLELTLDLSVGVLYAIVYYSIFFFAGRWLYNVFGIMTWWQVCLFQLLIWTSAYVFYELQWPINRLIHGEEPEPHIEKQKSEITEQNGGTNHGKAKNGEPRNGDMKNGEIKHIEVKTLNGDEKFDYGVNTTNLHFETPPFSTKSWSLKYRTVRNELENSKL